MFLEMHIPLSPSYVCWEGDNIREAMFYKKLENNFVHCFLCSHHCKIAEGKRGICSVRENIRGTLYSLVYGKLIANAVDPIEKNLYSISFQVQKRTR